MKRSLIACLVTQAAVLPAFAQEGSLVLPEITLDAESDTTLVQEGYVPVSSRDATKLDTPIGRIPQAVSIVTQDQIEDQAPQTLNEALGYSSGANPNNYGYDTRYDAFFLRGFPAYYNGYFRDGCASTTPRPHGSRRNPMGWKVSPFSRGRTRRYMASAGRGVSSI